MVRIMTAPGAYVQGRNKLRELPAYYAGLGSRGAYLIVDSLIYERSRRELSAAFEKQGFACTLRQFGGECSRKEIECHQAGVGTCDVIVGIGGGKTLDTAKAVAYYQKLPVIIVPTIASTDAPCSRLSVIYDESGAFESYLPLPANPNLVLVDTAIVAAAPVRFLVAGMGDALSTYYEAAACQQASAQTMAGGHATAAAMAMAKLCLDTLLRDGEKAVCAAKQGLCTPAVEAIIEANTYLSGLGFESGGLAAAHAIHNGLTVLPGCHKMLHGEKVAFGVLCQMVLENRPMDELRQIIDFCKAVGLPLTLQQLGLGRTGDDALMQAAKRSCAPEETMANLPFPVTAYDVFAAIKTADRLAVRLGG